MIMSKIFMARSRSPRVDEVKERLATRLRGGFHRPGDKFPSAREVAAGFGISYQTAHRIMAELATEGLIERRAASGSYVPGGKVFWDGAHLLFSDRARREGSFGARLLERLCRRLERDGIPYKIGWQDEVKTRRGYFPVLWEAHPAMEACLKNRKPALLLNDRPRPGLTANLLDSVSIDDFSGGAGAAQLLLRFAGGSARGLAVLAGPVGDSRSQARCAGFLSVVPGAPVVSAGSWFFEDGYHAAPGALLRGPRGLFCANDRLADAVCSWCRDKGQTPPPLVGFDDAPVAETLGLTTMAIPWEEFIGGAGELIKRRMNGDTGAARQLIFMPRPVVRSVAPKASC